MSSHHCIVRHARARVFASSLGACVMAVAVFMGCGASNPCDGLPCGVSCCIDPACNRPYSFNDAQCDICHGVSGTCNSHDACIPLRPDGGSDVVCTRP
jgi:hypothetical protein